MQITTCRLVVQYSAALVDRTDYRTRDLTFQSRDNDDREI